MTKYKFDEIAINSTQKKKPTEEDKVYYIGLEHIDPGCFDVVRWGSNVAPTGDKLLMQKGDVLFGKRRAYQRKVAIAPFDGIFSAHGMVLRPNLKVIDANYFPFFISSDKFMETAVRISVGGLSPTINWKDLARQEFELPSLDEQKVLADKLWAAYRLKEAYKKLLVATDEMVKSQFIEMFQDSPLVRLGDHIETQSGGTPNTKKGEYYDGGTIPWLSSGEVNLGYISSTEKYITEEGLENSAAKWVPKNSVVIAMYGATAGKVGFITIPLTTNQAVCALLPNDAFNPLYLYYAVSSKKDWMIAQCRGAAQPNISQGIIRSMKIPMPSLSEQIQFVNVIKQADKSKFGDFKSQFIEMFENVESYCKLEDLVSDTFPGEWGSEPISENAIKVIRTTNFTNEGYLDLTDVVTRDIEPKKVVRKKLKQGDTILERSGGTKDNPVGRVVFFDEIGDYLPNNFTQVLRPKESVNPVYLFYALYNSYNLNKAAMRAMASQTTGIQNLSMSDFMAKFIVLPSRNEQNKFEQIYRQADKSKSVIQKALVYLNDIQSDELGKIA